MHVTFKDQETGNQVILCVDREAHHAEAIQADPDDLRLIQTIAKAMGVETLYSIVPRADREKWEAQGWSLTTHDVMAVQLIKPK